MKPSISVFFPCYNDGGTIATMVEQALETLREIADDYEVYVINEGSTDNALAALEALARKYPRAFRFVNRDQPSGYGGVVRGGMALATKEWFFYTDGDGQYDPREMKLLVEKISDDVDLINGWKIARHDPWHRIVMGSAYQYFIRWMFGLKIRDVDCDFRLMRRAIFDIVQFESSTGAITVEMVKKIQDAGYGMTEVPVHHYPRVYGHSQFFSPLRVIRTLVAAMQWWWRLVVKREAARTYRGKRAAQAERRAQVAG